MRRPFAIDLGRAFELRADDLELLEAEHVGAEAFGDNMVAAFQEAQAQAPPAVAPQLRGVVPWGAEAAIARGERDENKLTDMEFYGRHPERSGAAIKKTETALAKEWLSLRDKVVRPALAKAGAPAPDAVDSPAAPPPPPGSNAAAAARVAEDTQKTRIIAAVLGGLAVVGIGAAVVTR